MGLFDRFRRTEKRSLENPSAPVSAANFMQIMGWADGISAAGITVNVDTALGVPAVWAAVNFIAGTIAGLPLQVFRKDKDGSRQRVQSDFSAMMHDAVNDGMSSFEWRMHSFTQALTGGRAVSYIERNGAGAVVNIWPFDPTTVRVTRQVDGRKVYTSGGRAYEAGEILDLPFMLKANMIDVRGPIAHNKDVIGMAIAATRHGSKVFQSGGIPPAVLQGPFGSSAAAGRASEDIAAAMAKLAQDGRPIMAIPLGHELKAIGIDPEKLQLLELQRFCVEQIARIYSLPPVFLQDLTHGTFSNTEQQDLHFVKHTVKRWVEQFEQEMNLKFFGRGSEFYVEFNVDGLLRGDFKARMEANALAIQNAIRTPDEVRAMENLPPKGATELLIQGATVPLGKQPGVGVASDGS